MSNIEQSKTIYAFTLQAANGDSVCLDRYRGDVLLIVNTASQCGLTNQYGGLQNLFDAYKDRGLTVIAIPCNQFAAQEPSDDADIQTFCSLQYNVNFPVMAKANVNGEQQIPLYEHLKCGAGGLISDDIKWNFTKFLINREGHIVSRHAPTTAPESLIKEIEALL